jgi:hypothetical protein
MTNTNPTPCGWAGQTCGQPAIVQTWQTDTDYPGVVTLDRPLCAHHVQLELDAIADSIRYSTPTVLHIAALGVEVTR